MVYGGSGITIDTTDLFFDMDEGDIREMVDDGKGIPQAISKSMSR